MRGFRQRLESTVSLTRQLLDQVSPVRRTVITPKKGKKGQPYCSYIKSRPPYERHSLCGHKRMPDGTYRPLLLITKRVQVLHATKGWRDRAVSRRLVLA